MTLADGERLILRLQTATGKLFLTDLRIWHSSESEFTSIRLEDVSSVAVMQLTHRWLLWITAACTSVAAALVWMGSQGIPFVGTETYRWVASGLLFVSAVLVMAFGTRRFTLLRITAHAAMIEVRIRSMVRKEIIKLVRDLEDAKNARYRQQGQAAASDPEISSGLSSKSA